MRSGRIRNPWAAVFAAVAATTVAVTPVVAAGPKVETGDVPTGRFGLPMGDYLTIEGVRLDGNKTGVSTLAVDTVNGRKLKEPVGVWVDNLNLPAKTRCVIKGYETLRMIGSPPAWGEAEEEAGRVATMPQAGWQVQVYFVALSVVEPKGLPLDVRRR